MSLEEMTDRIQFTLEGQIASEAYREPFPVRSLLTTNGQRIACSISDGTVAIGNWPARVAARNDS
jgi:hypothetical protein